MGKTEGPRESDSVGCQRYVRRGYDTNWYTNIPTLPLTPAPALQKAPAMNVAPALTIPK